MDIKSRKKLEAARWQTGDARDFLELSDAEAEFMEMRLALAQDLRARRLERHLNQTQVARIVGSSQSRVAEMEAADPSVSMDHRNPNPQPRPRSRATSGHVGRSGGEASAEPATFRFY